MKRRAALTSLGGAGLAGLAGCVGVLGPGCSLGEADVGMSANAFEPETLTVPAGTTVVWKNTSQRAHTVTADDGAIPEDGAFFASGGYDSTDAAREAWADGSGAIYSCETFEHTFEVAGTYGYICIPHVQAGMVGRIVVEE